MCGEGIFINSADEETPGKKKKVYSLAPVSPKVSCRMSPQISIPSILCAWVCGAPSEAGAATGPSDTSSQALRRVPGDAVATRRV